MACIEQIKYLLICACSHSHVSEAYLSYTWVSQHHGEAVIDPLRERERLWTVRQREKARVKCSQGLSISIVQTGGKPRQTRLIEKHRLTPAPSFVYLPIECCETQRGSLAYLNQMIKTANFTEIWKYSTALGLSLNWPALSRRIRVLLCFLSYKADVLQKITNLRKPVRGNRQINKITLYL